jgi:hypothetical protein
MFVMPVTLPHKSYDYKMRSYYVVLRSEVGRQCVFSAGDHGSIGE